MTFGLLKNKYYKKYTKEATGEDEVPVNSVVIYIFGSIFVCILLGILTKNILKPITINPFLLAGIAFGPSIGIMYLVYLAIKYINLRAFSDRYSFPTLYNNIRDMPTIESSYYTGEKTEFSIIPLGSAIVPNFVPLRGGGREGFLVVDKSLALNLGGTIFVKGDIIVTNVESLPQDLRVKIENQPQYKSSKNAVYYAVLEKKINGMEFDEYIEKKKEISMKRFWMMYDAMDLYVEHLEKRLNTSTSRVKTLRSI